MLGKSPDQKQSDLFKSTLAEMIDPAHRLVKLAKACPWEKFEKEFAPLYSHTGLPSKPVRMMVGLLLLKQLENLSDERVIEAWLQNPYMQYFTGEQFFQWKFPCDPSDLVHFRKRIGEKGFEKIFELSLEMNSAVVQKVDVVLVDTTVQEKNITFPTDSKLYLKIIATARMISQKEGIELRQSYVRVVPRLRQELKFSHHPRRRKKARKVQRKIKTIAGRLYRDAYRGLEKKGVLQKYEDKFSVMAAVLEQQRFDKNKVYSLHEPEVSCIAKGKQHKPYEFGSKVSFVIDPATSLVLGVKTFQGNPFDGHTLRPALEQAQRLTGREFKKAVVDKGYPGEKQIGNCLIVRPDNSTGLTPSEKRVKRTLMRKRAGIEGVISHIKHDHRMLKCFLKGIQGDKINAMMAAAAFNLKKWMELNCPKPFWLFFAQLLKIENFTLKHAVMKNSSNFSLI